MCGSRLDDAGEAAVEGPPRLLYSARALLPGLAVAAVVAFVVVMFLSGAWLVGVLVLAVAALAVIVFLLLQKWAEQPRSPVTEVRDRARFALAFVQVQSTARRQVAAIDAELHRLQTQRQKALVALGEVAYGGDDDAITQARQDVHTLDEEIEEQHETRRRVVEEANTYIERERGFVEPTEVVPPALDERPDVERHSIEPAKKETV